MRHSITLHYVLATLVAAAVFINTALVAACDATTSVSNATVSTHLPRLHLYPNDSQVDSVSKPDNSLEAAIAETDQYRGQLSPTTKAPSKQATPTMVDPSPTMTIAATGSLESLSPRLVIQDLNIDTIIESVGVTPDGYMETPSQSTTVAWYKHGSRWGQIGNTTITGHFNDATGHPAVFSLLHTLKVGATIEIKDHQTSILYQVRSSASEEFGSISLVDLFGKRNKSRLNLITCHGVRNLTPERYSHRWIIRADPISTEQRSTTNLLRNAETAESRP